MMLTATTQQMNQGEVRALYAKLGNLADPTWRMVGTVTRTEGGLSATFLHEATLFRPLWKACIRPQTPRDQDLLRVIFGVASNSCGVAQIATGFVTPADSAEMRNIASIRPRGAASAASHGTTAFGPAPLRTSYPSWMVNNRGTDAAGRLL